MSNVHRITFCIRSHWPVTRFCLRASFLIPLLGMASVSDNVHRLRDGSCMVTFTVADSSAAIELALYDEYAVAVQPGDVVTLQHG